MELPTYTIGGRMFTVLFPHLLRPLNAAERQSLKDSIKERGVLVKVVVDEADGVIDGGHRVELAALLRKRSIPTEVCKGLTLGEKADLALQYNEARRHLSGPEYKKLRKDRHQLILETLKAHPEKSDRQIGEETGSDHKTVAGKRR
jgi:ParB-like chromosome segregation protein Spo0J